MRVEPLSICENDFILGTFAEGQTRIDGRKCDEYRDVKVIVGSELGSCLATVGKTKVLAQVSCSVVEPKAVGRGHLGIVDVQVDFSPMGSPAYEDGKLIPQKIELTRILETLIRDGGVVDLEGLCLRMDKQVWQVHVDVRVLDSDGSLADCASIAALTALSYFRRPDVSVLPDSLVIHTPSQKQPVSLNIYHVPICTTFGITSDGKVVTDPVAREELCLKGAFVVAANKRHEICALHQAGNLVMQEEVMVKCTSMAIQRAVDVSELITSVIADDNMKRSKGEHPLGFAGLVSLEVLTSHECNPNELVAPAISSHTLEMETNEEENVVVTEEGVVHIGIQSSSKWIEHDNENERDLIEQVTEIVEMHAQETTSNTLKGTVQMEIDDLNEFLDGIEDDLAKPAAKPTTEVVKEVIPNLAPASGEPIQLSLALKKKKKISKK